MSRRERKKEETRANIIECAIDFFKEKGFQETSMEEIAEKSDISKGTLYNYFQDKESILTGYFQLIIVENGKDINANLKSGKDIRTRLNNLLDFISEIFGSDIELASIYFRYRMQTLFNDNPFDSPQRSGLEHSVVEIIKDAQENSEIRCDIPVMVIARNFEFLTMSFFISNIYTKKPFEMEVIKNQLIEMFLNGAKL